MLDLRTISLFLCVVISNSVVTALYPFQTYTYARTVNPCSPTPCGPNTECSVNSQSAAVCRCLPGHFPKPDTITGCGPQCSSDFDCPRDHRCAGTKCIPSCSPNPCGINGICEPSAHKPNCRCPPGYEGNPWATCRPEHRAARVLQDPDPCLNAPCGSNADCRNAGNRPVCTCRPGHRGDPYRGCIPGECSISDDCPRHQACKNYNCISPCVGACGSNAECDVNNHVAVCKCPRGYKGDPFVHCRPFDPNELCHPSPCGTNTQCRVENNRAICSCSPSYIGNPLSGCRRECDSDGQCPSHQSCIDFKCKNPCVGACGESANCDVRNNRPICSCPSEYLGDPYTRCYPECTTHGDCASDKSCIRLKCADPCVGACGINAECRTQNHKAVCSCPKGYTGHPFDRCRPFEPAELCQPNPCGQSAECRPGHDQSGKDRPVCTCPTGYLGDPLVRCTRGECITDHDCTSSKACQNSYCQDPCSGACGINARCEVRNHVAVCSCLQGYKGDPIGSCYLDREQQQPYRQKKESNLEENNSSNNQQKQVEVKTVQVKN